MSEKPFYNYNGTCWILSILMMFRKYADKNNTINCKFAQYFPDINLTKLPELFDLFYQRHINISDKMHKQLDKQFGELLFEILGHRNRPNYSGYTYHMFMLGNLMSIQYLGTPLDMVIYHTREYNYMTDIESFRRSNTPIDHTDHTDLIGYLVNLNCHTMSIYKSHDQFILYDGYEETKEIDITTLNNLPYPDINDIILFRSCDLDPDEYMWKYGSFYANHCLYNNLNYLVQHNLIDHYINLVDSDGWTQLQNSIYWNHQNAFDALLDHPHIDLSIRMPDNCTALHMAVLYNRPHMIDRLLCRRADPHAKNYEGYTPLDLAVRYKSLGIIRLFIQNGCIIPDKKIKYFGNKRKRMIKKMQN